MQNLYQKIPKTKKNLPNVSKQFLQWFSGFVDAEGCFTIHPNSKWTAVGFIFIIELHIDDIEILYKIAKTLGVGIVTSKKTRNSAVFTVSKMNDIISVILPIFNEFPLQTSKHLDFICFSKAILIKMNSTGTLKRISETNLNQIKYFKTNMNKHRLVIDKQELDYLTKKVSINAWWLLGFVEGEGTFGYKHLVPYFQVAQHKKNLFILNAIESYLLKLPKDTKNNKEFKMHYSLNHKTNVYSMSIIGIDTLYNYIVPFFEGISFQTRKTVDYKYWVISVLIHKYGFYYLPGGKKIALQISLTTNKYRYTTGNRTNKLELPSDESIFKLLSSPAPFNLASGLSHSQLVKEFTISKGGRKGFIVHIYDHKLKEVKELRDSPFSSYGAGHVAIGLNAGSRVIGRYIDTGKAYKDRYIFSSTSISVNNI